MQRQTHAYIQALGRGLDGPMFMTREQLEAQSGGAAATFEDGTSQTESPVLAGLIERAKAKEACLLLDTNYQVQRLKALNLRPLSRTVALLEGLKREGLKLELRRISAHHWAIGVPKLYVVNYPGRIEQVRVFRGNTPYLALNLLSLRLEGYTILGRQIQDEFVEVNLFKQV